MATNSVLQALMSGREEGRRKRAFEVDQQRVLAELKELERSSKASAEAEKRAIDLENFTIMQALREQLVTGQKHLEGSTGEMTQPGIPGTQEVSIPSPTQTLQGPFGEEQFDTQSIIRDIKSRRGEEERKLGLALQEALIKEIPKRTTEGLKAQAKLEETREVIKGREHVARIQARTRETPELRLEREKTLENIKQSNRLALLMKKKELGLGDAEGSDVVALADSMYWGLQNPGKDKASRQALKLLATPTPQFPEGRKPLPTALRKDVTSVVKVVNVLDTVKQFVREHPEVFPVSGMSSIAGVTKAAKQLQSKFTDTGIAYGGVKARLTQVARGVSGETGMIATKDVERAAEGVPEIGDPMPIALQKIEQVERDINTIIDSALFGFPETQKEDIVSELGFGTEKETNKKETKKKGVEVTEAEINRVVSATGVSREEAIAEIRKFK